jgi:hypothetical protein
MAVIQSLAEGFHKQKFTKFYESSRFIFDIEAPPMTVPASIAALSIELVNKM